MPRKYTKAEKIALISPSKIASLKASSDEDMDILRGYVDTLRRGYNTRIKAFDKNGLFSYAQMALELSFPGMKMVKGKYVTADGKKRVDVPIKNLNRNQLVMEYHRYSTFFNSDTGSIKGARRVNKEQDVRIFGANKRGTPNRTMTKDERTLFWTVYDEYRNQYPTETVEGFQSEFMQHFIGGDVFSSPLSKFIGVDDFLENPTDYPEFLEYLHSVHEKLIEQRSKYLWEDIPNVYSGRRNDI